jgi:hypothetical protein
MNMDVFDLVDDAFICDDCCLFSSGGNAVPVEPSTR